MIDEGLREMHFGALEGQRIADVSEERAADLRILTPLVEIETRILIALDVEEWIALAE